MPDTSLLFAAPLQSHLGNKTAWGNLPAAARALAIAEAASQHTGLSLVITRDTAMADRLEQELRFFAPELPVATFPDWETLPYDRFSPHQDIISQRLETLYRLPQVGHGILVVPMITLLHRIAPRSFLGGSVLMLKVGQRLDIDRMRQDLDAAGYRCVDTVYEHGDYAVRGALLDLFPMGSRLPYRIDLFDEEIETLRTFDPETQRSIDKVERIHLLPAREFPLDKSALTGFRARFRERFEGDHRRCPIYQDLSDGMVPPGIEYYLPLFFEELGTLFDYLPDDTLLFSLPGIEDSATQFWSDVRNRHEEQGIDPTRPLLTPAELFLPVEECFALLKRYPRIICHDEPLPAAPGVTNFNCSPPPELPLDSKQEQPLRELQRFLDEFNGRSLFIAETAGRREALLELLARISLKPEPVDSWADFINSQLSCAIMIAPVDQGLLSQDPPVALIAESQLFGQRVMQRRRRGKATDLGDTLIRNLTELREGAPVVHIDHGVGRYRGLVNLSVEGQEAEFLKLEYADEATLYVPVANLHMIARYTGADDDNAPLHRLGSEQWQKARRKAAEKVRDVAAELLDVYARRAARKGYAFSQPEQDYQTFADAFPFEETADQQAAIDAVTKDMTGPQPMDRLVCGDVGFGKTEVAMRAAFLAVHGGKQVAVLVPTTLLAQQHYNSFKDRFADWPVKVEVISRFRSAKEVKAATQELADGKIDIMIGTHKLLQGDVQFKDLGLVIIDEEHRFGVRQKERLKALRSEVDILNLTATPIPRTLNMAMTGMRDLSIIATPPARRLSVKTFVMQQQPAVIKEAILRELLRGGQVYFLHNEVETIEKCAADLAELVPEARIGISHGQMPERALEQVMRDFYHRRFNILVTSTIIETGIDVPSANTIIIERADKFGLAQLHQLRGRVGRSHHQAYAYLLTPAGRKLTGDAEKRLEAIAAAQDLGAGFTLATHDLEIRGAGELLGEGQSGQIQAVGFTLYMDMLERAIKAIQQGKEPELENPLSGGPDINLRLPALIPDDYLPDVHARLTLYKRIANAANDDDLKDLQVEMIDRFGLLPEQVKTLFRVTALKLRCAPLGIAKIDVGAEHGRVEFAADTSVDPLTLIRLIQDNPQRYRLDGGSVFRFSAPMGTAALRLNTVEALVERLQQVPSPPPSPGKGKRR
ncbi:transcription-repair coupling factor [Halopseudomonas bauzanensis]|uniref:Transcription-repair-coupling factor n=1 Tax=Halopseudomonas bauzanensis TaxID=653930 RepID=A0A4U0YPK7_9GAMM|nr:transcription-repair coupling factor [Halopseudomonas bauzanensis]EZQ19978.1 transcription-repair coupling factor [Halopseudomonas bauzanensis]TKA91541.1 transcription-repair coupling factor [Halopseudomonas bauzanensis]